MAEAVKIQHMDKDIGRNYLDELDNSGVFANLWDRGK
jgi:hypothetical protein